MNDDAEEFVEDFLAHYGIKGMRWGVRRSQEPSKVRTSLSPGRRVRTTGGEGQKASADAVRAAIYKQKARRSTTDSLSDAELKKLLGRMKMETEYKKLKPESLGIKAAKFLTREVLNVSMNLAKETAANMVREKIREKLGKDK